MARAAVRAFIPCRRVAAPGVVRSSEIAGFHPPVDNAHLADRNDRNPHLRPTPAGVQAQPRRSRSRRLGERNSSGRRARDGGWERPERRRCWTGKALARRLRSVVKHPLRNSPSCRWFALDVLCKVDLALALPRERISKAITTPPIRLCVRAKRGMCDGSGNQNLTTRVAIEDTSMPTPLYHKTSGEFWPPSSLHSRSPSARPRNLM